MGKWYQLQAKLGIFSAASFMPNAEAKRFLAECYAHD
jgi:hypothetical protein